jgi:hypothetical protein
MSAPREPGLQGWIHLDDDDEESSAETVLMDDAGRRRIIDPEAGTPATPSPRDLEGLLEHTDESISGVTRMADAVRDDEGGNPEEIPLALVALVAGLVVAAVLAVGVAVAPLLLL